MGWIEFDQSCGLRFDFDAFINSRRAWLTCTCRLYWDYCYKISRFERRSNENYAQFSYLYDWLRFALCGKCSYKTNVLLGQFALLNDRSHLSEVRLRSDYLNPEKKVQLVLAPTMFACIPTHLSMHHSRAVCSWLLVDIRHANTSSSVPLDPIINPTIIKWDAKYETVRMTSLALKDDVMSLMH